MLPVILLGATFLLHYSGNTSSLRSSRLQEDRPSTKSHQLVGAKQITQKPIVVVTSEYIYSGDGHTPLMLACDTADVEQVKLLLSKNVSINAKNKNGITALMLAAKANSMTFGKTLPPIESYDQIVALLLQHGADVNSADKRNNTVLTYAALGGDVIDVKILIAKGALVNTTNAGGTTMLHAAALSGNLDTLKFFIAKGVNVNAVDDRGRTPLWLTASWTSPLEAFKLLIDNGADVKVRNSDGETLLMEVSGESGSDMATRLTQESKAKLLIEKGIDIDAQSDLSLAAQSFNSQLGGFGVDRSMATSGKTALMFAVREHDPEMIKLLLAHGANVNLADEKGQTALMHACLAGMQDNAILLLKNKADPNSADSMGTTAVMIATKADNLELCEALFDKGADPNFRDDDGKRAADYVAPDGKIWKAMGLKPSSSNIGDNPDGTTTPLVDDGNDKTAK